MSKRAFRPLVLYFFLMGLTTKLPLTFVGKIACAEWLGLAFLFWALLTGKLKHLKPALVILFAGLLWVGSIALSNTVNEVVAIESLKSVANAGFLLVNLTVLTIGFRVNENASIAYSMGWMIAAAFGMYTDPDLARANSDYFQTVILPPAISAGFLLIAIYAYRSRFLTSLILSGLSVAALVSDSRANFLILAASFALMLYRKPLRQRFANVYQRVRPRHVVALTIALYAAYVGLVLVSSTGTLGTVRKAQVARMQNMYNPIEYFIYNGRPGLAVAYLAIRDKPILGHGVDADGRKYIWEAENRFSIRFTRSELEKYGWVIPSHSIAFGAWVDSGIIGGAFWLGILVFLIRSSLVTSQPPDRISAWFAYCVLTGCYMLIFSPLSYNARQLIPFVLAVTYTVPPRLVRNKVPGTKVVSQLAKQ